MVNHIEIMIIDKILNDIYAGIYKPKDKLPSENQLADACNVPRIIIRKAYEKLEGMGYIYSIQGKGRYVKERYQQIELVLSGDESFSKKMLDKGLDFQTRNVFCEKIEYDPRIYSELGVDESDEVYKIGRLRIVDDRPVALHISYAARSLFSSINKVGQNILSMFEYYKNCGYKDFCSEKSILSISFPDIEERRLLECSNLIPLLTVETNCMDKNTRRVLEYTKIIYIGDSFRYVVS